MCSIRTWWQNNRYLLGPALASTAAVVALGYGVLALGNIDELRRFAAVQLGMTEDEVLAAVGKPPGEYGPPGAQYGKRLWLG